MRASHLCLAAVALAALVVLCQGFDDGAETESLGENAAIPSPFDHPDVNILKQENERLHASVVELLYKNGILSADLKNLKTGNSNLKLDDDWLKNKVKDLIGAQDEVKSMRLQSQKLAADNDRLLHANADLMDTSRKQNTTLDGYRMEMAKKDQAMADAEVAWDKKEKALNSRYEALERGYNSTRDSELRLRGNVSSLTGQVTELDISMEEAKLKSSEKGNKLNSTLLAMQSKQKQGELLREQARMLAEKAHAQKMAAMNESTQVEYLSKIRTSLVQRNDELQEYAAVMRTKLKKVHQQRNELSDENTKLAEDLKRYQDQEAAEAEAKIKEKADARAAAEVAAERKVKNEKHAELKAKSEALRAAEAKRANATAHEDVDADNILQALHGPSGTPGRSGVDADRVAAAAGHNKQVDANRVVVAAGENPADHEKERWRQIDADRVVDAATGQGP